MEYEYISPFPTAMRWGLVLGLVAIAASTITFAIGGFSPENQDASLPKFIGYGMLAVIILVLVIAMQQHRDNELGGYMAYGRGLALGTLIGLFYSTIAAITVFIIYQFFMPSDYAAKMLEVTRDKMLESNPNMGDDEIEMGLSWARRFINPSGQALMQLVGGVFLAFIFSLLVSAFVKKSNPNQVIE